MIYSLARKSVLYHVSLVADRPKRAMFAIRGIHEKFHFLFACEMLNLEILSITSTIFDNTLGNAANDARVTTIIDSVKK